MVGNSRIAVLWSDLPKELVEKIADCFDTETDVLRFRAVCNPWRTATAPFKKFNPSSIKLPFPVAAAPYPNNHDGAYFTLTERTVYRVQRSDCKDRPDFWLVKTETSKDGKLRILNPLNDREIKILPENIMPKVLNTLDFRVSEVCKSYALKYVNPTDPSMVYCRKFDTKVVVSASAESNEYAVMVIDDSNKLWYIKSGDEKWTMVQGRDYHYSFLDIINYKGQFRGIDHSGRTWYFNSMLEVAETSYFRCLTASKRHLVEVSDELFLIEEVTDKDKRVCTTCDDMELGCQCNFPRTPVKNTAVEIVISRTNTSDGELWVDAKKTIAKLMGRVIFVGDDCSFSVPAEGVKGPLVFYTDRYIYFRTEEEKKRSGYEGLDDDYGYHDYDSDCGYNPYECDCCVSSDDEAAGVDSFVPSNDVKLKFRGLHGHNSGVYDFQNGKMGSLLRFPEHADVFWPPPAWLNRS